MNTRLVTGVDVTITDWIGHCHLAASMLPPYTTTSSLLGFIIQTGQGEVLQFRFSECAMRRGCLVLVWPSTSQVPSSNSLAGKTSISISLHPDKVRMFGAHRSTAWIARCSGVRMVLLSPLS